MTGTPLDRAQASYAPAPGRAAPLRQTRTVTVPAPGGLILTVHAAHHRHDALAITRDDGLRLTIPMPPGALLTLHRVIAEALGLPAAPEGGAP